MSTRLSKILDVVTSIAMVAASISLIWMVVTTRRTIIPESPVRGGAIGGTPVEQAEIVGAVDVREPRLTRGTPEPTLAIIEFSDFQCPFCGRYAREVYPMLRREFVETGKVQYLFRNFPLETIHPMAMKAAEAAGCAGRQGKFWELHDILFSSQESFSEGRFQEDATTLGLKIDEFRDCMNGQGTAVREDLNVAKKLGVTSTPTFFVGEIQPDGRVNIKRRIIGAQPYQAFKSTLDELLSARTIAAR